MGLHDDDDDGEKKRMRGIIYIWACVTTKKKRKKKSCYTLFYLYAYTKFELKIMTPSPNFACVECTVV